MSPDFPLSPLQDKAMTEVCPETQQGWLWYCHEHDTHGNADFEEEARMCAEAHSEFWMMQAEDDEPCDVWVWLRTRHERTVEEPSDP